MFWQTTQQSFVSVLKVHNSILSRGPTIETVDSRFMTHFPLQFITIDLVGEKKKSAINFC